jgi:hypothetical protein
MARNIPDLALFLDALVPRLTAEVMNYLFCILFVDVYLQRMCLCRAFPV